MRQRTLQKTVSLNGVGLHSGQEAEVTLRPAGVDTGIQFIRKDLPSTPKVLANFSNVHCTCLATTLQAGEAQVRTVEHLMAAFHGLGIDNCRVEVSGPEVPILDGSAAPFYAAVEEVGVREQVKEKPYLILKKEVSVQMGDRWAKATPSSQFEIDATVDWEHPVIGTQSFRYVDGVTSFREISQARTFGFLKDVETLKAKGLIRGGSLENAVVLDEEKVMNPEGLRYADEFVRHKVLDAIGDFKLSGVSICAKFELNRGGHEIHQKLLAEIFRNSSHYEYVGESQENPTIADQLEQFLIQASRVAVSS